MAAPDQDYRGIAADLARALTDLLNAVGAKVTPCSNVLLIEQPARAKAVPLPVLSRCRDALAKIQGLQ